MMISIPKKKPPLEHIEQCGAVRWFDKTYPELSCLLFAIPNGGARHPAVGKKLKAEGVRKGVPDLMLAIARHGFHGLFIEMKAMNGRASHEQLEQMDRLTEQGYLCAICKGEEAAKQTITDYLSVK